MSNNIFFNQNKIVKIIHIILFIITGMYLLECIFIRGLFTNVMLACINMLLGIISFIIAIIYKNYKLAVIDFSLFSLISIIFTYLIYWN